MAENTVIILGVIIYFIWQGINEEMARKKNVEDLRQRALEAIKQNYPEALQVLQNCNVLHLKQFSTIKAGGNITYLFSLLSYDMKDSSWELSIITATLFIGFI